MATEKYNIILHDYPEHFTVSEEQRADYYDQNDKPGKRLQQRIDNKEVIYKIRDTTRSIIGLFDTVTKQFISKNEDSIGEPKMQKINGQMLWSAGSGSEWNRRKMKNFLQLYFKAAIIRQNLPDKLFTPKNQFIHFEYVFFYPFINKKTWHGYQDYINHAYVYSKVFEDTLQDMGIIPSDSPQYVRGGYARYVDIADSELNESRRLEIKIHFCNNNERLS